MACLGGMKLYAIYLITWIFRDMLILWFWGPHISRHINFAILRKLCILTHFNFTFLSETLYFFVNVKPWPNGVASRPKLKTWVYLRLRLASSCVHLRWLAMTCAHLGRDQICTQVDASFSPFGHPTQVNASWVTSINLLLANEIEESLP